MQTDVNGGGEMRPFFMEDILCIANGVRLTKADMAIGNRRLLRDRPSDGAAVVCEKLC